MSKGKINKVEYLFEKYYGILETCCKNFSFCTSYN